MSNILLISLILSNTVCGVHYAIFGKSNAMPLFIASMCITTNVLFYYVLMVSAMRASLVTLEIL